MPVPRRKAERFRVLCHRSQYGGNYQAPTRRTTREVIIREREAWILSTGAIKVWVYSRSGTRQAKARLMT
jgi:hypothetical protein